MRLRTLLAGTAVLAASAIGSTAVATAASAHGDHESNVGQPATVTAIHGIPGKNGVPVDILVKPNGKKSSVRLKDVTFGQQATAKLKPGYYEIDVFLHGTWTLVTKAWSYVPAGENLSVIAHLDAWGKPEISIYDNDKPSAGSRRLIVRHDAYAPKVDIVAGKPQAPVPPCTSLTNPGQCQVDLPLSVTTIPNVGIYVPALSATIPVGDVAIGALAQPGHDLIVYAVGNANSGVRSPILGGALPGSTDQFQLLVQVV